AEATVAQQLPDRDAIEQIEVREPDVPPPSPERTGRERAAVGRDEGEQAARPQEPRRGLEHVPRASDMLDHVDHRDRVEQLAAEGAGGKGPTAYRRARKSARDLRAPGRRLDAHGRPPVLAGESQEYPRRTPDVEQPARTSEMMFKTLQDATGGHGAPGMLVVVGRVLESGVELFDVLGRWPWERVAQTAAEAAHDLSRTAVVAVGDLEGPRRPVRRGGGGIDAGVVVPATDLAGRATRVDGHRHAAGIGGGPRPVKLASDCHRGRDICYALRQVPQPVTKGSPRLA